MGTMCVPWVCHFKGFQMGIFGFNKEKLYCTILLYVLFDHLIISHPLFKVSLL